MSKPKTDPKPRPRGPWADSLIPENAVGVPPAVAEASEHLRVCAVAQHEAGERLAAARLAATDAAHADAAAAAQAVESGEPMPAPTVAATEAARVEAGRVYEQAKALAERAALKLERRYREAGDAWLPAAHDDAAGVQAEMLALLDEFAGRLDGLASRAALARSLQAQERSRRVQHCRAFKTGPLARNELAALREVIEAAVPPMYTEAQRAADEEARLQHRRREVGMGRAGIGIYAG